MTPAERSLLPTPAAGVERARGSALLAGMGTAVAAHRVGSDDLAKLAGDIWPDRRREVTALSRQLDGGTRYLCRPLAEMSEPLSLSDQHRVYLDVAVDLAACAAGSALAAAGREPASITTLIAVSCTGFVLPGLDVHLVSRLGLGAGVVRMPFSQFGCAGGAAGLARAAERVAGDASERVLVVAVELPSITFRPADRSVDNLLSTLVFGDGAGAAVVESRVPHGGGEGSGSRSGPALERTAGVLLPGTRRDLGWELVDGGYRVILSPRLPRLIRQRLGEVVGGFLGAGAAGSLDVVAAHAGGPAILDAVAAGLGLRPEQIAASRAAFRQVGNTSSASLFFVLEELFRRPPGPGGRGLGLAFGPGVSIEMMELRWAG